jgi:hypothetical protein
MYLGASRLNLGRRPAVQASRGRRLPARGQGRRRPKPGGRYGDEALRALAAGLAPASAASVIAAVAALLGELGGGVQDDTALLALGVPCESPRPA